MGKRAWLVIAGLFIAYAIAGVFLHDNAPVTTWWNNVVIVATPIASLLFIFIYTGMGIFGRRAKWWTNPIGTSLVILSFALCMSTVMLAWAALFNHGALTTSVEAWIYLGGVTGAAFSVIWLIWIWINVYRRNGSENDNSK